MKENVITQATEGQIKQNDRFLEDFFQKLRSEIKVKFSGLSVESAQKFIGNGREFKNRVEEAVEAIIREMTTPNKYADEEVGSSYTYPKEYKIKPIAEQVQTIATMFGLDGTQALDFIKTLPALPEGAEGWFAIPKVSAVAKKYFPAITDPALQYCEVLKFVHCKVSENRSFINYREGQITTAQIRQHPRTQSFLELLESQQQGDILILAVQYGLRHKGKSIRRARETFSGNEFGLGAFAIGCMALVHPERYVRCGELDTYCPGDEFAPDADSVFSGALLWSFGGGELGFGTGDVSYASGCYGSVSAFAVPQI